MAVRAGKTPTPSGTAAASASSLRSVPPSRSSIRLSTSCCHRSAAVGVFVAGVVGVMWGSFCWVWARPRLTVVRYRFASRCRSCDSRSAIRFRIPSGDSLNSRCRRAASCSIRERWASASARNALRHSAVHRPMSDTRQRSADWPRIRNGRPAGTASIRLAGWFSGRPSTYPQRPVAVGATRHSARLPAEISESHQRVHRIINAGVEQHLRAASPDCRRAPQTCR